MRTYVHTKIYEVRRSAKGWSEAYEFYFSKAKAAARARELQQWAEQLEYKQNFRVIERNCEDSIIYSVPSED